MACYNPDTEDFQSVCRVMSGFSDSFYKEVKWDVDDVCILESALFLHVTEYMALNLSSTEQKT